MEIKQATFVLVVCVSLRALPSNKILVSKRPCGTNASPNKPNAKTNQPNAGINQPNVGPNAGWWNMVALAKFTLGFTLAMSFS